MDRESAPGAELTVSVRVGEYGAVVVRPEGELDHDTAEPFRQALDAALAAGVELLVVDCSGLGFCDSTGLNLLLRARLGAEAGGGRLVLATAGPVVARMLEITGAEEILRMYDTVDDALADADPGADAGAVP